MDGSPARPRPRRRLLRALLIAAGGVCLAAGVGWLVLLQMYGIRTRAGWIDSERRKLPPLPPTAESRSGPDLYAEAAALVVEPGSQWRAREEWAGAVIHDDTNAIEAHLQGMREIRARNEPALRKLHEAALAARPAGRTGAAGVSAAYRRRQLALRRVARDLAMLAHVDGDDRRALGIVEDLLAFAVDASRGGDWMGLMTGETTVAVASGVGSWVLTNGDVSAERLREHARVVRAIHVRVPPFHVIANTSSRGALGDEAWHMRLSTAELAKERMLLETSEPPDDVYPPPAWLRAKVFVARLSSGSSMQWSEDRRARFVEELATKPLRDVDFAAWERRAEADVAARRDVWAGLQTYSLGRSMSVRYQRQLGSLAGEETIACIEAYRLDHGRLPAALADLVPDYMPELPVDPWTGKPLLYSVSGDANKLYAAGPNKQDDGGVVDNQYLGEPDQVFVPVRLGKWTPPELLELPPPYGDAEAEAPR